MSNRLSRCLAVALLSVLMTVGARSQSEPDTSGTVLEVETADGPIALVGGILFDIPPDGLEPRDLPDAVVVIQGDSILAVGAADSIRVPGAARVIDLDGKWIVPGLIDGFAALNGQAYADAYLKMGVTSVVGVGGGRRGELTADVEPGPRIFRLGSVGEKMLGSEEAVIEAVDQLAADSVDVALLMYRLDRTQLAAAVSRAREHGMATIGELGFTSYAHANELGVDAFVHTTRYSMDPAPHVLSIGVANEPFSDDLDSPKWQYYNWLTRVDLNDPFMSGHISRIGSGHAALMPTLSLFYLDLPDHENPWNWPAARGIDSTLVDEPAGRATGNHNYEAELQEAYSVLAARVLDLERRYRKAGARYVTGSGTDVGGTMPGISLHTELELLTRIGLTPREALEAATVRTAHTLRLGDLGRVASGYRADLAIIASDPSEDIRNLRDVSMVVAAGRVVRWPDVQQEQQPE